MNEIKFTKVNLPYGWLGNMSPFEIEYKGKTYRTTEALFQSLRYSSFPEIQELIREQKSPMAAKMIAKKYKNILTIPLLSLEDVQNMSLCLELKLTQHPKLKNQLTDTENKIIIEDCSNRMNVSGLFWGCGIQENKYIGKNILGKIWMEKRKKLLNNSYMELIDIDSKNYF